MNGSEKQLHDALVAKGFIVLRRGWPDFLVVSPNKDRGFGLELKSKQDKLSEDQRLMHEALAHFGLPVLVAREDFSEALRKKGRVFMVPQKLSELKERLDMLEGEKNSLAQQIEQTKLEVDAASVLFDGETPKTTYNNPLDFIFEEKK